MQQGRMKMLPAMISGLLLLLALSVSASLDDGMPEAVTDRNSFSILLSASPKREDEYCQMRAGVPEWALGRTVIGFEPLPGWAAHHIILFKCNKAPLPVDTREDQCIQDGSPPTCGVIMFVWAHGGNPFYFPPGVGFNLGTKPEDVTFTLQVHFGETAPTWADKSGVRLILAEESRPILHDPLIWLLIPFRFTPLPPDRGLTIITDGLPRTARSDMVAYAVRTHAHTRGVYNEITVKREGKVIWHYRRDTQLPQSFVPLEEHVLIRRGDDVTIACAYDTSHDHKAVREGPTRHDEMCNIYVMYYDYVEPNNKVEDQTKALPKVHSFLRKIDHCASQRVESVPIDSQIVGVSASALSNHVFVFHRGSVTWDSSSFGANSRYAKPALKEDVILELDGVTGELIRTAGADQFYLPHAIRADAKRANIVWLIDVGAHVVVEYDLNTKQILRTIGQKNAAGKDAKHLCLPTDVAFSPDDSLIYVSDGYCNSRILVFKKHDLSLVSELAMDQHMSVPHSIEYVQCGGDGLDVLLVTDRENGRVLLLGPKTGALKREIRGWNGNSYPYSAVADPSSKRLYVGLVIRHQSKPEGGIWMSSHGVCDLPSEVKLEGELVCNIQNGEFEEPHMLALLNRKLYVAESGAGKKRGRLAVVRV